MLTRVHADYLLHVEIKLKEYTTCGLRLTSRTSFAQLTRDERNILYVAPRAKPEYTGLASSQVMFTSQSGFKDNSSISTREGLKLGWEQSSKRNDRTPQVMQLSLPAL